MFTFLKVPWAKTITDIVCVAKEKITCIKHELTSNVPGEEAYRALVKGFQKAFNIQFKEEETLTAYERKLAETLRREKYTAEKWNL
jgi:lipoate-protein ligase A